MSFHARSMSAPPKNHPLTDSAEIRPLSSNPTSNSISVSLRPAQRRAWVTSCDYEPAPRFLQLHACFFAAEDLLQSSLRASAVLPPSRKAYLISLS